MFMNLKHSAPTALLIFIFIVCVVIGCGSIPTEVITTTTVDKVAVATISAIDGSELTGTATFTEIGGEVHVVIKIQNATPGLHAAHIHIGSSCTDVGPHWHPVGVPAGTVGVPVAEATSDIPPIGIEMVLY